MFSVHFYFCSYFSWFWFFFFLYFWYYFIFAKAEKWKRRKSFSGNLSSESTFLYFFFCCVCHLCLFLFSFTVVLLRVKKDSWTSCYGRTSTKQQQTNKKETLFTLVCVCVLLIPGYPLVFIIRIIASETITNNLTLFKQS